MIPQDIMSIFKGKRVAVIGGGNIGQGLINQLLDCEVELVRVLESDEGALLRVKAKYAHIEKVHSFQGDIREYDNFECIIRGMDYVFHTAACKNVPPCEGKQFAAIGTNVYGTENLIRAALHSNACRVLFASSGEAVNPTDVIGASKLMGERIITSANTMTHKDHDVVFACIRFGNVSGVIGSIIPLLVNQIRDGGPVTVTDNRATRFVMTIAKTCHLLMRCLLMAKGGEVFVAKMPVVRIKDLAEVMIKLLAPYFNQDPVKIDIVEIGTQHGENLNDELLTAEEVHRTVEMDSFFSVLPALMDIYAGTEYDYVGVETTPATEVYNSEKQDCMTYTEIADLLLKSEVLEKNIRQWIFRNHPDAVPISTVHNYWRSGGKVA